jgi:NhaP-type Na+/H+ or K+/H+ antiporter
LLFSILSSKKLISNKSIRHFAKKVKKYRLKYGIFNDTIWFVYLYAVFMALLQFTQASFTNSWDTVNMVVAVFIFIFMMVYTVLMIYLGNKFKDPKIKVPTKWEFFRS